MIFRPHLLVFALAPILVACDASDPDTQGYEVVLRPGLLSFRGIDRPRITSELPGDVFIDSERGNRFNASMRERVLGETEKATAELRRLLPSVGTETLIESIRHGYEGEIWGMDYEVALQGNLIVGAELASRQPIPREWAPGIDPIEGLYRPFVGISAPPLGSFESFVEYAREMESRLRQ